MKKERSGYPHGEHDLIDQLIKNMWMVSSSIILDYMLFINGVEWSMHEGCVARNNMWPGTDPRIQSMVGIF